MLNIELYTSGLMNPVIQALLIDIGGLKWNVSLDLVSLNFNVSSGFLRVCLINVSQFLVIAIKKTSVSFLGWTMPKFN